MHAAHCRWGVGVRPWGSMPKRDQGGDHSERLKDIRRELVAVNSAAETVARPAAPGSPTTSGADPVCSGRVSDGEGRPDLGLDAGEEFAVGVAEQSHPLALELAGNGAEVNTRVTCKT